MLKISMHYLWILTLLSSLVIAQDQVAQPPVEPKRAKQMPAGDEPDKAAEFYMLKRVGPGVTDLPLERYAEARQRTARMPSMSLAGGRSVKGGLRREMDLGGWVPLGPGNQGGRTKSLVIDPRDPKIMYAGAVTGGVWKTTDGGENWVAVSDMLPSLGLGALALDPSNPDVIYAGTGFWFNTQSWTSVLGSAPRGAGLFRSRDAGASWEALGTPGGTNFRYINDIVVSRNNSQRIYVASWSGIFRSVDGGQNWTQVLNRGLSGMNGCQDMVSRTDPGNDVLFAACGTTAAGDAAIFRNLDAAGTGTWAKVFQVEAMGNTTLAIAPSNQDMVYALMSSNGADDAAFESSLHAVYRSTANGDEGSWEARVTNRDETQVNTGLLSTNSGFYSNQCVTNGTRSISGQGWIHNAIAVDPQDPERVYAGGIDVYRSDDGGKNWGIASFWQAADGPSGAHADVLSLVFAPDFNGESKPNLYVVGDGGVYLTENARAAVAVGDRAGCTPYQNRVAWKPLHGGFQSTQFYSGAVLPGGATFLGGKQDNGTMRGNLADGGKWLRLRGGDGAAVAVDPRDPNTMFLSTQNFSLARTRNGGRTSAITMRGIAEPRGNFAFIAPLTMDQKQPDRLYAGGRTLWRTADQGDNWVAMSTQLATATGTVSAIAVSPADGTRVAFATSQGFVVTTANALEASATTEWEVSRPRPDYAPGLSFDPVDPNLLYVVYSQFNSAEGQSHVYRSRDGGKTWEGIDGSGEARIPDVPVFCLIVDPQDRNRLYVGTDLGVFVSQDGGSTWSRDVNPFAAVPTETLVLDRSGGAAFLYAFTFGRGVWRTILPGSGSPCSYDVEELQRVPAFGGTVALRVTTGEDCTWSVTQQGTVLDVLSPATGKGSGVARLSVPLNVDSVTKLLGVVVQDKRIEAVQAAALGIPAAADAFATPALVPSLPFVGFLDSRRLSAEPTDPKPSCALGAPAKTVWLVVDTPESGLLEVVTQGRRYDVFGNSGVVVAALAVDGGAELGCVALPRDRLNWAFGSFRFTVTAASRYYLMVSATGNEPADGGDTVLGLRMVKE